MAENYQLAIIGSGSGGRAASLLAAQNGLRTALIEKDKIGGTCFHSGCYAVLALQASAREFRDRWRSGRFGNRVELFRETLGDWMRTQSSVSSRLVTDLRTELAQSGIDLYHGYGQFCDERTIQIADPSGPIKTIVAENTIVATGSRPRFYNNSAPRLVNSDQLLRIQFLPERLVVVGAGYIGCEFASIYRTLGCAVTIVEQADRVLPAWEPEAGELVRQALEIRGVCVQVQRQIALEQIEYYEEGARVPVFGKTALETDLVLVATGRQPNLEGLGLGALGIEDGSFLKVDRQMRLRPSLYAIGDVNGISLLDSTAFSQASVAIESILGRPSHFDPLRIPRCIHTEPAAAAVGLLEEEAAARGLEYLVVSDRKSLISDLGRTIVDPEPTLLKVIVDARSRKLLGCLAVGDHAPVIVNIVSIAIQSELTVEQLLQMPLIQPSASEALTAVLRKLSRPA